MMGNTFCLKPKGKKEECEDFGDANKQQAECEDICDKEKRQAACAGFYDIDKQQAECEDFGDVDKQQAECEVFGDVQKQQAECEIVETDKQQAECEDCGDIDKQHAECEVFGDVEKQHAEFEDFEDVGKQQGECEDYGDVNKQQAFEDFGNVEDHQVECEHKGDVDKQKYAEINQIHRVKYAQVALEKRIVRCTSKDRKSRFEFDIEKIDNVLVTGLIAVENDKLVLCNFEEKHLLVYNTYGRSLQVVSVSSYPFDIALLKASDRAVISFPSECHIQFIDISLTSIAPEAKMTIKNPSTGGISTFDNKIAVGKRSGVDIYALNGELVTSFDSSLRSIYYLKYSEHYFGYTDLESLVVKVLKSSSKLRINKRMGRKFVPHGFAFDEDGNIFYTNFKNNEIMKYCIEEKQFCFISGEVDGFFRPRALCLSTDNTTLYISNNDGQSIYVFSLEIGGTWRRN